MKKSFFVIALASLISLAGTSTQASERSFADVYADCGIGNMLFGNAGESGRILAIISNVTWDLGTTAHSSNASSEENCKGGEAKTAAYIYHSYPAIESDLAKGQGEYLTAMLDAAECSVSRDALVSELRINLSGQLDATRESKSAVVFDTMSAHCVI